MPSSCLLVVPWKSYRILCNKFAWTANGNGMWNAWWRDKVAYILNCSMKTHIRKKRIHIHGKHFLFQVKEIFSGWFASSRSHLQNEASGLCKWALKYPPISGPVFDTEIPVCTLLILKGHQVYEFLVTLSYRVFRFPLVWDICTRPRGYNHATTKSVTYERVKILYDDCYLVFRLQQNYSCSSVCDSFWTYKQLWSL